jgi:hypothetical protein
MTPKGWAVIAASTARSLSGAVDCARRETDYRSLAGLNPVTTGASLAEAPRAGV